MMKKIFVTLLLCYFVTLFFVFPQKSDTLAAIRSLDDAWQMEKRAEEQTRPSALGDEKYLPWYCHLTGLPLIGEFLAIECRYKIDAEWFTPRVWPSELELKVSPPPENVSDQSAGIATESAIVEGSSVRAQGPLDSIRNWLLRTIIALTGEGEFLTIWPSHFTPGQANVGGMETMQKGEQEEASSDVERIVKDADFTEQALLPAVLGEGVKSPGVPLPPELEPSPTPLPTGVLTPTPLPSGIPTPTSVPGRFWYTIRHRDSSVVVGPGKREEIINLVLKYWPSSKIGSAWDYVEERAIINGWNPSFVIALWIEESGASGVHAWDVGCTGAPQDNLAAGLNCLFGLPYANRDFPQFLCIFSEGHYPCTFSINPNFPKNLKAWYDRLAPPGTPGAAEPL